MKTSIFSKFSFRLAPLLALLLVSCQADVRLAGTLTDRGVINRSNIELGNVYLWNRAQKTITRVNKIDASTQQLTPPTAPVNSNVGVSTGASFVGGATLTSEEQVALEAEVASRSSIVSKELSTSGFRSPIGALIDAINADPNGWLQSLNVTRENVELPNDTFLVFVHDISVGKSLSVTVDRQRAVGASFKSNTIKTPSGNLKFRIIDAGKLELDSPSGNTNLYARLSAYKTTSGGNNGLSLRLYSDKGLMTDLANTFVTGN